MRLDKWLWAARFYKTRSLACDEITLGRVQVNGADVKPARELRPGDTVRMRQGWMERTVVVLALSERRGPAPEAQTLYEETADSTAARERAAQQRRDAPEPASALAAGRPTKRDRRDLDALRRGREGGTGGTGHRTDPTPWNERWSASLDD